MADGEMIALKRRILAASGEQEFNIERVRTEAGVRRRYVVWSQAHLTHLENIAHPENQTVPNT